MPINVLQYHQNKAVPESVSQDDESVDEYRHNIFKFVSGTEKARILTSSETVAMRSHGDRALPFPIDSPH
jgi:hypothetical protein